MGEKCEKSYQIFYSNNYMNTEYFAQLPGGLTKAEILAKDLAKKYDHVRIEETTVIKKTVRVYT